MARRGETNRNRTAHPRLTPDALQAALREAAAHRVEGRHGAAAELYGRIERSHPEAVDATYFLALLDLIGERPAPALARLLKLARRLPQSFDVWQALAYARRELGQWREAIEASRRALRLRPTNTHEQFELAGALEVVGALDESLAILRDLAGQEGQRLAALARISRLKPDAIGPAEQDEIAAAAGRTEENVEVRISLYYALGEILERQGRYDEAFTAFAAGAGLKRETLTGAIEPAARPLFSPAIRTLSPQTVEREERELIGFMKAVFTPEFMTKHEGQGHHLNTPIFIVGMPRSGSTLLEQILSSHPRVQGLGETGALIQTVRGEFPIKLFAPDPPGHFRKLADAYLAAMHDRGWTSSPRFIDKMLYNYPYIGLIHLMFPKAVILHSVRDPVETCLANFRMLFMTGQETSYDLADIGRQYVRYREMMDHWSRLLPGRVIDVSHEALVSDPADRIRWLVSEACGLPWDEACLSFHKTRRAVRTASVAQVRQPIFSTSLQRWRRYEQRLGPLFDALGPYAPIPG
ncbi:MAG: sulfotransferase [Caulobacteraceae bacterium]|nr:sulfotransferase [Caulobacteraceae bacterium]